MFFEYLLFLAKIATFVIAILIVLAGIIALTNKGKQEKAKLEIKKLNDKYDTMQENLRREILSKPALKKYLKEQKKQEKLLIKSAKEPRRRVFVLNFQGDIKASAVKNLREEITALLLIASTADEVVLRLESPGGLVHGYGLAASELMRIRQSQIPLTVIVDKMAASGGYMMAAVGNKILAAPFAIVGSIGVIAQLPNFHEWLKKHNIEFEQIMAGQYKRTLTLFGENTHQGRAKFQEEVDVTHELFKGFVRENRPILNINEVATGEHWYGIQALALRLIDDITTSDDYLFKASHDADVYEINYVIKKSLADKFFASSQKGAEAFMKLFFPSNPGNTPV